MRRPNLFVTCLLILNLSGCSVLMVANRESKRDLNIIRVGAQRSEVMPHSASLTATLPRKTEDMTTGTN